MNLQVFNALDQLPKGARQLFDNAERQSIFSGYPWFHAYCSHLIGRQDEIRMYLAEDDATGLPLAVLPLACMESERGPYGYRVLSSLANYYSSLYGPVVDKNESRLTQILQLFADGLMSERPRWHVLNLKPMDNDSPVYDGLLDALRRSGFVVQPYFCFGNWYLETAGRRFEEYFSSLPSQLRNTIRRKEKRLFGRTDVDMMIVTDPDKASGAMDAYEAIYQRSWKQSEPYQHFIRALVREAGLRGWLRLGVIYVGGEPAAAQIWIVCHGIASIYKLAYDERFADLSVGSILTRHLMQRVIDVDGVTQVDYLTGDDAYKRDWMSNRRERWGLMAFNTSTFRGALLAARHVGAAWFKSMRRGAS